VHPLLYLVLKEKSTICVRSTPVSFKIINNLYNLTYTPSTSCPCTMYLYFWPHFNLPTLKNLNTNLSLLVEPKVLGRGEGGNVVPVLNSVPCQDDVLMYGQWQYSSTILFCKAPYSRYDIPLRCFSMMYIMCSVTTVTTASIQSSMASTGVVLLTAFQQSRFLSFRVQQLLSVLAGGLLALP
jgi:hypothetical protein